MTNLMSVQSAETMTSLQVAEATKKRHSDIMRDIRIIEERIDNQQERIFALSSYLSDNGKRYPMYELTKS